METMTNKYETVYGIYEGSVFEGGSITSIVYRDIDDAVSIAVELVNIYQQEDDNVYEDDDEMPELPYKWEKNDDYTWTNGLTEVCVLELKVK